MLGPIDYTTLNYADNTLHVLRTKLDLRDNDIMRTNHIRLFKPEGLRNQEKDMRTLINFFMLSRSS